MKYLNQHSIEIHSESTSAHWQLIALDSSSRAALLNFDTCNCLHGIDSIQPIISVLAVLKLQWCEGIFQRSMDEKWFIGIVIGASTGGVNKILDTTNRKFYKEFFQVKIETLFSKFV